MLKLTALDLLTLVYILNTRALKISSRVRTDAEMISSCSAVLMDPGLQISDKFRHSTRV